MSVVKLWLGCDILHVLYCSAHSIVQRWCQTGSSKEIQEVMEGLKARYTLLGANAPLSVTADNCCDIAAAVLAAFVGCLIFLDTWHALMR